MKAQREEPEAGVPTSAAHRVGLEPERPAPDVIRDVMSPCPRALGPDVRAQTAAELMPG